MRYIYIFKKSLKIHTLRRLHIQYTIYKRNYFDNK